jgi:hypothetical protein
VRDRNNKLRWIEKLVLPVINVCFAAKGHLFWASQELNLNAQWGDNINRERWTGHVARVQEALFWGVELLRDASARWNRVSRAPWPNSRGAAPAEHVRLARYRFPYRVYVNVQIRARNSGIRDVIRKLQLSRGWGGSRGSLGRAAQGYLIHEAVTGDDRNQMCSPLCYRTQNDEHIRLALRLPRLNIFTKQRGIFQIFKTVLCTPQKHNSQPYSDLSNYIVILYNWRRKEKNNFILSNSFLI